jgi:hypothetical protein
MKKINWKKGLFSSKYRLFDNNIEVGEFSQSAFSSTSLGKINEVKLRFKKKGLFSSETEITDLNSNQLIGNIKFNSWRNKAEIKISNKKYLWKYDNFWNSKWSISENGQQLINYKSSTTSGNIESSIENDLLMLSGLYVYNYYVMMMIIIAASTTIIVSGN